MESKLKSGTAPMRSAIEGRLNFPIIVKRGVARGTTAGHITVIAYDMHDLFRGKKVVFETCNLSEHTISSSDSDSSPTRS